MDGKVLRAASFLKRTSAAENPTQRLLCLYDGFVCLYGPMDACRKASEASGLDRGLLDRAIDSCMDEDDSPATVELETRHIEITDDMVSRLFAALTSIVEKAE